MRLRTEATLPRLLSLTLLPALLAPLVAGKVDAATSPADSIRYDSCRVLDESQAQTWPIAVDRDGRIDLLVLGGRQQPPTVRVLRNLGHLEFDTVFEVGLEGAAVEHAAIADFDGDGHPDVVTLVEDDESGRNGVVFLRNIDGSGKFDLVSRGPSLARPLPPTIRDLDRDGRPDLVVADFDVGYSLLFNRGDFTFFETRIDDVCQFFTFGDWDGNGRIDGFCGDVGDLSVLVDVVAGLTFGAAFDISPAEVRGLSASDLDHDGRDEILVSTFDLASRSSRAEVFSLADGQLVRRFRSEPIPALPAGIRALDLDRDGLTDLLFACDGLQLFRGSSGGSFGPSERLTDLRLSDRFAASDLDADRRIEIVTGCRCGLQILCASDGTVGPSSGTPSLD